MPRASLFTVVTSKPPMAADAGLVPCAESGTMTRLRFVSPRASWYALNIRIAVSSACAPAAGWSVTSSIPLIPARSSWSSCRSRSAPWTVSSGWCGWMSANPGNDAARSLTFGLYFIVQEPNGYMPASTE